MKGLVWEKKADYPKTISRNEVDRAAFDEFVEHFHLTEMFHTNPSAFCNVEKFMRDGRSVEAADNDENRLLPHKCLDHAAAYKDAEGHVLVLSMPYGINEEQLEQAVRDKGMVAVILDNSHRFYPRDVDMFVLVNADSYDYFSSQGCFDNGWGVKVLR